MTKIPTDALIVAADGGGARLFRNVGSERSLSLHQVELMELQDKDDDGPAGVMPAGARGEQIDEATFAKQLAQALNAGALKQRYDHLVLMADPVTLGRLRPLLHKETLQRTVAEIGKGMASARVEDIERALQSP